MRGTKKYKIVKCFRHFGAIIILLWLISIVRFPYSFDKLQVLSNKNFESVSNSMLWIEHEPVNGVAAYVPPQPSNCGEKFRDQPAGKESADQSQSVHPAAAAGPPCRRHRPDHFHWRLWRTDSGCCCTSARDMPCVAGLSSQGAGNSRPVPSCGYRHSGFGCPC